MLIWNWRYKVFLDRAIFEQALRWEGRLQSGEAEIFDTLLRFYRSFFSFGMLYDMVVESPERAEEYLSAAENGLPSIIKTPESLYMYYMQMLLKQDDRTQRERLFAILDASMTGREILPEFWKSAEYMLGGNADTAFSPVKQPPELTPLRQLPAQNDIAGDYLGVFEQTVAELKSSSWLQERFGAATLEEYEVKILEGPIYGEWWDREISPSHRDLMILYKHDGKMTESDFFYTVIHETYPGHGHFYNAVRNADTLMDHGAMTLIEGWATYCEWNTWTSAYINVIKNNALRFLKASYVGTQDAFARQIRDDKARMGKTPEQITASVVKATQYIGLAESYYIGALWLEDVIDNKKLYSPAEYLNMLRKSNKGEFFRLWQ